MRNVTFLACAAAVFGAAPLVGRLEPAAGALVLVALGVALACAASGGTSGMAVACGALGAFAAAAVATLSPAVAGAVILGAAYAERTTRARGGPARAAHAGVALVAGALGGALGASYDGAALGLRAIALAVAAVIASLPLLVDVDDRVAHALDALAGRVRDPARASLRQGAELRRSVRDVPLERAAASRVRRTWSALQKLAEARLRLERAHAPRPPRVTVTTPRPASPGDAVLHMVDRRIAEHVAALTRAYDAADSARAAEIGLDDADLRSVESVGDALEDTSEALIDVQS